MKPCVHKTNMIRATMLLPDDCTDVDWSPAPATGCPTNDTYDRKAEEPPQERDHDHTRG